MTRKCVLWGGVGLLALALAGFAVWIFTLPPPSAVAAPPVAAGEAKTFLEHVLAAHREREASVTARAPVRVRARARWAPPGDQDDAVSYMHPRTAILPCARSHEKCSSERGGDEARLRQARLRAIERDRIIQVLPDQGAAR